MGITLDLPDDLVRELSTEAERLGLTLPDYVLRVLRAAREPVGAPRTGAELVAYWEREGVLGSRSDDADSPPYARQLRARVECRSRADHPGITAPETRW